MIALSPLLKRFAERTPLPVLAHSLLERHLSDAELDHWFEQNAQTQYTRTLLFSQVYQVMTQVVFRRQNSINQAYQQAKEALGVSLTALYDKLNHLEPGLSAGLVALSADKSASLIRELGGSAPALLPGYRVRVLDGNALGAREHRLKSTRAQSAAPLPGKSLNVYEPDLGLITLMLPCEDAYTQERALVPKLKTHFQPGDLWVADRNFCLISLFDELEQADCAALIRQHEQVSFKPLEFMSAPVCTDTGYVSEQYVQLYRAEQPLMRLRRVRIELHEPDRDGQNAIYLLTSLPREHASAFDVAELYRKRWRIETAFQKMTVDLRCEINTLGYPKAALFGFAVAVVAYNILAVLFAALRAAHPQVDIDQELSFYYIAHDLAKMTTSVQELLDPPEWVPLIQANDMQFAQWMRQTASNLELRRYKKSPPRGKKKPKPPRHHDPKKPHVSVSRLLKEN